MRCFVDETYAEIVKKYSKMHSVKYSDVYYFIHDRIEKIKGPEDLKEFLNFSNDDATTQGFKKTFRDFAIWFLENRATRYILAKESKIIEK